MSGRDFRRNFLLAAVAVIVAFVLVKWLIKAAFMLVLVALVAVGTVIGGIYLFGKMKDALGKRGR